MITINNTTTDQASMETVLAVGCIDHQNPAVVTTAEINFADLFSEIELPININSDIVLPFPKYSNYGLGVDYKKYQIILKNVEPNALKDKVILKLNMDLIQ